MTTNLPIRYIPNKLTRKDKQKQIQMLKKSRKMYKKGKYYTRKQIPSFKNKKSNHITDAYKIYNIKNIKPNKELVEKTGCSLSALNQIVKKVKERIFHLGQDRIKPPNRGD